MWHAGERAIVRGENWQVVRSRQFADCQTLEVAADHTAPTRTFLLPFDRPRPASPPRLRVVSRGRWASVVRTLLSGSFPYGGLQFFPPAIRLLPFQLEPALAVLRHGALRILVADDVGLGKTVEAGLIVREVAKSDQLSRTLVLVPAGLRTQWAQELSSLFELEAIDADAAWLRRRSRELPASVNPWALPGIYLSSLDFIKRPEALRPLEDVRWDLLVVDEAHTATPRSDRRAAVDAIAARSLRVVLLSATPHSGDDDQFRALCELGATGDSPPIVCFSRSRADTALADAPPRSVVIPVRLSQDEQRMHRLLEDYTSRVWTHARRRGERTGELVATVLRKRALSSAASLALSIRRRLELLGDAAPPPAQLALPLFEDADDRAPDAVLGAAGLEDLAEERPALETLLAAAHAAAADEGKLRAICRLFRRTREPAIIFSEYRDTAVRLCTALTATGRQATLLHGGQTHEDRRDALTAFGTGRSVLVATDAASEGLNLHHGCRLIVHFELPWTPLRLHQRCGRVNRIGQARRVHEIALVASDTAEQLVLVPLLRRAARSGPFARAEIVSQLAEARVAAHVIGGTPVDEAIRTPAPRGVAIKTMILREEAREEAERLALLRRARHVARERTARDVTRGAAYLPVASRWRQSSPTRPPLTLVVFAVSLVDESRRLVERQYLGVAIEWRGRSWERRPAALRAQLDALLPAIRERVAGIANGVIDARLVATREARVAHASAVRRRTLETCRPFRSTARELVQAGLFDRRALRAAGTRARAAEMLEEPAEESGRGDSAVAGEPGASGTFDIAAILLGGTP